MIAVAERTKRCALCHEVKPWPEYRAHTRWPDGSTRYPRWACRPCENAREAERYRRWRREGCPAKASRGPGLPPGPFRAWLQAFVDRCATLAEAGVLLQVDPRHLRRHLAGHTGSSVLLATVERALCRANDGTTLDDLYPLERAA